MCSVTCFSLNWRSLTTSWSSFTCRSRACSTLSWIASRCGRFSRSAYRDRARSMGGSFSAIASPSFFFTLRALEISSSTVTSCSSSFSFIRPMSFMRAWKDACRWSCWSRASVWRLWDVPKQIFRSLVAWRFTSSASSTVCSVSRFHPYGSPVVPWFSMPSRLLPPDTMSMHFLSRVSADLLSSRSLASVWRTDFSCPITSSTELYFFLNLSVVACSKAVCFFSSL
mmetsp:Transcript_13772/g.29406  ORF Transcript_13772/g.29406 Transcript_13772/m.29406 type:complete len:226 (+) Transcript_13772:299-976(+)